MKQLLSLTYLLMSIIPMVADNTKSSAYPETDGLVWHYSSFGEGRLFPDYTTVGTSDIDGKQYSLFPVLPYFLDSDSPHSDETIGLRKENGVVYGYFPDSLLEASDMTSGEVRIYDFNATAGQEYRTVGTFYMHPYSPDDIMVLTAKVLENSSIRLFGAEKRVQKIELYDGDFSWGKYIVVEDIGLVFGCGSLAQPAIFERLISMKPQNLGWFTLFDHVTDKNGTSYSATDMGLSLIPQIVNPEAQWIYYASSDNSECIYVMGFGEQTSFDGTLYNPFYTKQLITRNTDSGEISVDYFDAPSGRHWLMREVLGKVYMREVDKNTGDELLLYDFTLQNGDLFRISPDTDGTPVSVLQPREIEFTPVTSDSNDWFHTLLSQMRKSYTLADEDYAITALLGVSAPEAGFLPSPAYLQKSETDDLVNPPHTCTLAAWGRRSLNPAYSTQLYDDKVLPILSALAAGHGVEDFTWHYGRWPNGINVSDYAPTGNVSMKGIEYAVFPQHLFGLYDDPGSVLVRQSDSALFGYFTNPVYTIEGNSLVSGNDGEYMIYDYAASVGDEFSTVATWASPHEVLDGLEPGTSIATSMKVTACREITLAGKKRRVLEAAISNPVYSETRRLVIVEGIGIVAGIGLFSQPIFSDFTVGSSDNDLPIFAGFTDSEGVKYSMADIGMESGMPLVNAKSRWEYYSEENGVKGIHYMGFSGNETVDGNDYSRFFTLESYLRKTDVTEPEHHTFENPEGEYWLLRESLGKIFMRQVSANGEISPEYAIYDFALQQGEQFPHGCYAEYILEVGRTGRETFSWIYASRNQSTDVKRYAFGDGDWIVDGAGVTGRNEGFLPLPAYMGISGGLEMTAAHPSWQCSLSRVLYPNWDMNRDEEVWMEAILKTDTYTSDVEPMLSGLSAVATPSATDTSAVEYYNLQGVRIDSPAKGQTVIRRQAGRSEKIIIR